MVTRRSSAHVTPEVSALECINILSGPDVGHSYYERSSPEQRRTFDPEKSTLSVTAGDLSRTDHSAAELEPDGNDHNRNLGCDGTGSRIGSDHSVVEGTAIEFETAAPQRNVGRNRRLLQGLF